MRRFLIAVAFAGIALAGCSTSEPVTGTPGKKVAKLDAAIVPGEMLALKVKPEDANKSIGSLEATYAAAVGLYSLRSDDLVQATLQIVRMIDAADYRSESFRATIVNRIGSRRPRAFRLGTDTVYLTTGTKQTIATWFRGPHLFILNIREDYPQPRALLREALEIKV